MLFPDWWSNIWISDASAERRAVWLREIWMCGQEWAGFCHSHNKAISDLSSRTTLQSTSPEHNAWLRDTAVVSGFRRWFAGFVPTAVQTNSAAKPELPLWGHRKQHAMDSQRPSARNGVSLQCNGFQPSGHQQIHPGYFQSHNLQWVLNFAYFSSDYLNFWLKIPLTFCIFKL